MQAESAIFLTALFDTVAPLAKKTGNGSTGVRLATEWAEYLNLGQTTEKVGDNRKHLYVNVVKEAKGRVAKVTTTDIGSMKQLSDLKALPALFKQLLTSCSRFQEAVSSKDQAGNVCLINFDEAHTLTTNPPKPNSLRRMSPYHNLGKVLAELCNHHVFFIFLSTNSNLQQFAPAPYDHPSLRVSEGYTVFPPFTELPFDVFNEEAKTGNVLSLTNVCAVRVMSCFGRPMWYVHHQLWERQQKDAKSGDILPNEKLVKDVITFAIDKIGSHGIPEKSPASQLAAMGIRVGITFDSRTRASRLMEAKHVESHMRVVYAVPAHREYMRTGSPSEPILAEGAARCLDDDEGIKENGPKILADSCRGGFLARGERGELCGRLLVTIAHDLVIQKLPMPRPFEPIYHRPIAVLDFLHALFAESHHDTLLQATPVNLSDSQRQTKPRTLKEAFQNAYVSFSHFEVAQDSKVLEASQLRYSLVRGCAIQAKENQVSIDAVIPIHMGSITDPITTKTTSAINLQFKNRKDVRHCPVDRSITVPDVRQPAISIVFEFGQEPQRSKRFHSHQVPRPETPQGETHVDDYHYTFIARGHGPETFNVVSERSKIFYDIILGTGDVLHDFPRADNKGLVTYVEGMQPLRSTHAEAFFSPPTPSWQIHSNDSYRD
ncbi:hypothetical protein RSAG8_05776, partial [Rhizoctonia solani AG-8 WAC10335]